MQTAPSPVGQRRGKPVGTRLCVLPVTGNAQRHQCRPSLQSTASPAAMQCYLCFKSQLQFTFKSETVRLSAVRHGAMACPIPPSTSTDTVAQVKREACEHVQCWSCRTPVEAESCAISDFSVHFASAKRLDLMWKKYSGTFCTLQGRWCGMRSN